LQLLSARTVAVRSPALRTFACARVTQGWSKHLGDVGYWTRHHLTQELRLEAAIAWAHAWTAPEQSLHTPVLIVRGEQHRADLADDLGWRDLADVVSVVHVPGNHVTMLASAHRHAVSAAVADGLAGVLR